jgi:polysaccharide export outer membrane protein
LIVLGLLGGCAGKIHPIGGAASVIPVQTDAMPEPVQASTGGAGQFQLRAFDKLRIEVFGVETLQRTVSVDGDGRFAFPLVGQLQASGKTPAELGKEIELALRSSNYVRNPDVTVTILEAPGRTVAVDGQVKRAGEFPVLPNATLMRAVALAGGVTEDARVEDVVLFRNIGDKHYVGLYNLGAIRRGGYPDPQIFSGDVVVVGESKQRRLLQSFLQTIPLLTTPLILLLQNSGSASSSGSGK